MTMLLLSDTLMHNENCLTCARVMKYFTREILHYLCTHETIFIVHSCIRQQYNIVGGNIYPQIDISSRSIIYRSVFFKGNLNSFEATDILLK